MCAVSIKLEIGKGSDKQNVLGIRDGKGFSVPHSGEDDIMTSTSSFNLCRGIQPGVLAAQIENCSDGDSCGLPKNFDRRSRHSFGVRSESRTEKPVYFGK